MSVAQRQTAEAVFSATMFCEIPHRGLPHTTPLCIPFSMPRTSTSRKTQRKATVYGFVPFLVRRLLGWRIGSRGVLLSRSSGTGLITVIHRVRDACDCDVVDRRIAQLRPEQGEYQLFWKKGNGRWTAYFDERGERFVGSLAECLEEISRDPLGCYWS